MKKFLEEYKRFKNLSQYGKYRLCWIPFKNEDGGIWSVMEFFDSELKLIDKNKVEVVIK